MSSNSSGKKLEGFFTGKGFYIVLFLCAAVIGVSAWMMAAGNEAMDDLNKANNASFDNKRVETIIIPPEKTAAAEPVSTPLPVIAGDAKTPADTAETDQQDGRAPQALHRVVSEEPFGPLKTFPHARILSK